jgi:hypothetical protein
MALDFQVLSAPNLDEVYAFGEARLKKAIPNEDERKLASWSVKWRKEELEHYLKLGWSFYAKRDGRVTGFFLAQPLLFFRGNTQTLWVEHLECEDHQTTESLVEIALKISREKHLQCVLFSDTSDANLKMALARYKPQPLTDSIVEVKTSK